MIFSKENKHFLGRLAFLSIPMVGAELLGSLVNLLDSFMIGSLGLDSINGVGFANQIFFLFWIASFGVNSGAAIFMGQFWGKREPQNVRKVLGITVITNLCVATFFATASWTIPETLIGFYSKKDEVIALGTQYLQVAAFSFFFAAVSASVSAALKSCGQTRLPLVTTITALCVNAGLNCVFIFVLHWGVRGAATATVCARAAELTVQLLLCRKLKLPVVGKLKDYFQANRAFLKEFFLRVSPVIANELSWAVGTTCYTAAYQFCGNASQGAQQIAATIQSLFFAAGLGIGGGLGILIANKLGEGDRQTAIKWANKGILANLAASCIMGLLLFAFSGVIVRVYNVGADVRDIAKLLLIIIAVGLPLRVYNFTTIVGILRSGGDTKYCLMLDAVGVWVFGVPSAFLGAYFLHLPIYVVFIMVYSEEVFKLIFSSTRVFGRKWANTIV